ncbi:hypothetical protein DNU06_14080 [Putridiphycobacter roseus]|uniref:DNA-binding response regulator n=1 Tax=Putridiphycobacter roseus TaxID=2219161 RepID=A0A2W1NB20_9FLAO|nr:LytTR family DNA-binding domain-containing protein [Putridiphycobacter roseus]PZE16253.1 hypothetical protein DNU06_14080 [Putridiphycobacter roseus]
MKCLVVDDDAAICDLIQHFCKKEALISSCTKVMDGKQAIHAIKTEDYDLIILDYHLPDLTGANLLDLFPTQIPVIMISSELDFGIASYNYEQVVDFLLKPLNYKRFSIAIEKVHASKNTIIPIQESKQERLVVKDGNESIIVKIEDIKYVKSEGNYVVFYLKDKKVMTLQSLKLLATTLPSNFIRVQKSFIVNLNFVERFTGDEVIIAPTAIPVGAAYKNQFQTALEKWIK